MFMEYIIIFKYFFFCFFVSIILLSISIFLVFQKSNFEKISIYECGFSPFGDSSGKFEMRFYIVAILFMIFDLEIVFLFPWMVIFNNMLNMSFFSMMMFLMMLLMGFFYEFWKGALDWE